MYYVVKQAVNASSRSANKGSRARARSLSLWTGRPEGGRVRREFGLKPRLDPEGTGLTDLVRMRGSREKRHTRRWRHLCEELRIAVEYETLPNTDDPGLGDQCG